MERDAQELFGIATCARTESYLLAFCLCLIVVDWAHTFPSEVSLMWPGKLSAIKVLYFLNRYFIVDIVASFAHMNGVPVLQTCKTAFYTASIALVVGFALAEAVMYIRLYALSGQSRVLLIILSLQFLGVHVGSIVLLAVLLAPTVYTPSPIPSLVPCWPDESDDSSVAIFFGIVMGSEFLILVYTCWIGFKKHRQTRSPLLTVFYRDGMFYFMALLIASTANIVILFSVLPTCKYMFNIPQRALHSIIAGRTILHLREQTKERREEESRATFPLAPIPASKVLSQGNSSQGVVSTGQSDPAWYSSNSRYR